MEAINDVSKLVAKSLEQLKEFNEEDKHEKITDVIKLLEQALDKLVNKI